MFYTAESCMSRVKEPERKVFKARYDIMDDRSTIVDRLRREFTPHRHLTNVAAPTSRSMARSTMLQSEEAMLKALLARRWAGRRGHDSPASSPQGVVATFNHIFDHFRRGVFVSVRNGKVKTFMGFVNRKFQSPYGNCMHLAKGTLDVVYKAQMESHVADVARRQQDPSTSAPPSVPPPWPPVVNPRGQWTAMGCLVSNVLPNARAPAAGGYEPDFNFLELRFLMHAVCDKRRVPDCDFFVNYYDQCILRDEGEAPFWPVGACRTDEVRGRRATKPPWGCPVVSMCSRPGFSDLPFVTPDDISRVWKTYGIPKCSNPYIQDPSDAYELDWDRKVATAVFRGSATGCGWTCETNHRLALAVVASTASGSSGAPMFDVVLTGKDVIRFKMDPHDAEGPGTVRYFRESRVVQDDENKLSFPQQSRYKYVIHVEGNVAAYRLGGLLGMGSVVLYVESEYRPWFYAHLLHMRNCFFVRAAADLPSAVAWCRAHDEECRSIAAAGLALFKTLLQEQGLLDYSALLMRRIAADQCLRM